jgi:hypothetical protein
LNERFVGALDALGWVLVVLKKERRSKTAGTVRRQILHMLETEAEDFEFRT